jgi:molybdate transport system ATP-binding protein
MTVATVDIVWRQGSTNGKARFTLPDGITVLIGKSGAGKSTLSRLLMGLETPVSGTIDLCGDILFDTKTKRNKPAHQRSIGWIPQSAALFPHMNVVANIKYGSKQNHNIEELLDLLAITHLKERMPHTLSGGEARRVAIARALASNPKLLIMDEPTVGLDAKTKDTVLSLIKKINTETRTPILMITHDYDEMVFLTDHMLFMDQGQIIASGTLDEISNTTILSNTLGLNEVSCIITGTFEGIEDGLSHIKIDGQSAFLSSAVQHDTLAPGTALKLRLRSRDISLSLQPIEGISILNQFACSIEQLTKTQHHMLVTLKLRASEQKISAQVTHKSAAAMGLHERMNITALVKAIAVKNIKA